MATYGARTPMWAPFAAETPDTSVDAIPKYQAPIVLGQLNKVTDSMNFGEGSLPGDDMIVLYEKQFKDGKVEMESVYIDLPTAAKILGCASDEANGLAHGDDDDPPYGGYGFLTHHVGGGKHSYQVVFYPKVRAMATAGETYTTRGDNLTFATDKLSFHLEDPLCRKHKVEKDFDTEAAAKSYLQGLFAATSPVPGLPHAAAANVQAAGQDAQKGK